jgi:hypothetical protein
MTLDQIVLWVITGRIAGLLADALLKGYRVGRSARSSLASLAD